MPLKRLMRLNTKDSLWLYVITIIKDNPMHAYELKRKIESKFGFKTGNVTIYKVLYLLSWGEYVEKKKVGRRVVYSTTEKGIKALDEAKKFYRDQIKRL